MFKIVAFVVLSACFVYVSRASLRSPRSHGFYRFFAWELVLGLVLLNLDRWFHAPLVPRQVVSWLLLAVSAALAAHGTYLLHRVGKPGRARRDGAPLIGIEKTTSLVTVGAYRYIRHPLYGSILYGAWGVYLKDPTWVALILVLAAVVSLVVTARVEEAECIRYFGPPYRAYRKGTKMFVPFVF